MNTIEYTSKSEQAREAMLALIHARGAGVKLPTLQEMCTQFKMSRTPMEHAMQTLERQGLLRRKRGSGIYVSEKLGRKTIGVAFGGDIFNENFSPFWRLLLKAVREQAGERSVEPRAYLDISEGYEGLGGHMQLVEDLEERRLDGLLLMMPQHVNDEAGQLSAYGVPMVVFGGRGPAWTVTHDTEYCLHLAARELASNGCRRVGFMEHPSKRPIFEDELRKAGKSKIKIEDWSYDTWASIIPEAGTRENCACRMVQQIIADAGVKGLPDTVVSTEDTSTRGVIAALHQAGLQLGRDIKIITSENKGSPVLESYAENLIRIEFDPAESVRAALDMLDTLMNGNMPPQNPVLVKPRII